MHDLETARRRLTEAGADVSDDTSMPDVHRFYASDPFGNRIEFVDAGDGGFTVVGA